MSDVSSGEYMDDSVEKKSYALTVVIGLFVFFLSALLLIAAKSGNEAKKAELLVSQNAKAKPYAKSSTTQAVAGVETNNTFYLEITEPQSNTTVTSPSVIIRGKTLPSAEVFINGSQLRASRTGYFTGNIVIDPGENKIFIVANDAEGNYGEKQITLIYKSLVPTTPSP